MTLGIIVLALFDYAFDDYTRIAYAYYNFDIYK